MLTVCTTFINNRTPKIRKVFVFTWDIRLKNGRFVIGFKNKKKIIEKKINTQKRNFFFYLNRSIQFKSFLYLLARAMIKIYKKMLKKKENQSQDFEFIIRVYLGKMWYYPLAFYTF